MGNVDGDPYKNTESEFSGIKTVSSKSSIFEENKAIITIKEARKLIGKQLSSQLSDKQVSELIKEQTQAAELILGLVA